MTSAQCFSSNTKINKTWVQHPRTENAEVVVSYDNDINNQNKEHKIGVMLLNGVTPVLSA